jgi:hypothetical protein
VGRGTSRIRSGNPNNDARIVDPNNDARIVAPNDRDDTTIRYVDSRKL